MFTVVCTLLAERAAAAYEASRGFVSLSMLNQPRVLLTRGTTTGLNWIGRFCRAGS